MTNWCKLAANIISILCFTFLAVHFEKWGIAIVSLLFAIVFEECFD